jgi:hypothetical protein
MVGIIGIIASLTVLGLSLVITRLATVSLNLTGLSWETAKFQARSAFTGTGFTTSESETIMNHPVRRKIIMGLMVARSAGLVSIIISLNCHSEATETIRIAFIAYYGLLSVWRAFGFWPSLIILNIG